MDDLKNFGIALGDPALVEEWYLKLKGVFVHTFSDPTRGLILDLNAIQPELKTAVIKWLISVNLPRLKAAQEPVVTLALVLKCPVWRFVSPPLKSVKLTREAMFGRPAIGKRIKNKGINR